MSCWQGRQGWAWTLVTSLLPSPPLPSPLLPPILQCSVGDRNKYEIHLPLPPKIDPTVTMMQVCVHRHTQHNSCSVSPTRHEGGRVGLNMVPRCDYCPPPPSPSSLSPPPSPFPLPPSPQVEEKPDVTYEDIGGCKEQIEKLREVVETPLLHVRSCSGQGRGWGSMGSTGHSEGCVQAVHGWLHGTPSSLSPSPFPPL